MWRWVYRICVFLAVTCGVSNYLFGRHLVEHAPRAPDVAAGAAHYHKGVAGVVYLTDFEFVLLHGLLTVAFVSGLICLVLLFTKRVPSVGRGSSN